MTRDDFEAMWSLDEPEPAPVGGCTLLLAVTVLVWLAIGLGVWAVIAR